MQKNKILVLGSIAFDYLMGFEENFINAVSINLEKEEFQSTVTANSRTQFFGGTAGNISYNLGVLNIASVHLFGSVGKDFKGLGYKDHMSQFNNIILGIDVYDNLFTAACYIVNDVKANQMIIFHGGAMEKCTDINLKEKVNDPENFLYAINSTQSVEAMTNFALQLKDLKIPQIFDPGQVTPLFPKDILLDILNHSEILIGNTYEIEQITQKTELSEGELLKHIKAVIITQGGEGSTLMYRDDRGEIYKAKIPICKPEKIEDTTGAGDGYRAGLLTGLSLDMTLLDSCRLGSVIGSFVIETKGAQTHQYTLDDVKKRFYENFNYLPQELEKM
ncbi:MAG: carbohydrate kinase family protein [Candidatus Lokiarchaeota archaeon]|nr:carbohydrate kinase family protein [Candidatus Lokiarchaeota archaeon]